MPQGWIVCLGGSTSQNTTFCDKTIMWNIQRSDKASAAFGVSGLLWGYLVLEIEYGEYIDYTEYILYKTGTKKIDKISLEQLKWSQASDLLQLINTFFIRPTNATLRPITDPKFLIAIYRYCRKLSHMPFNKQEVASFTKRAMWTKQ